ncbi:MAG: hypothetical protein WC455_04375 [Dehalococcoidia bacterium]
MENAFIGLSYARARQPTLGSKSFFTFVPRIGTPDAGFMGQEIAKAAGVVIKNTFRSDTNIDTGAYSDTIINANVDN